MLFGVAVSTQPRDAALAVEPVVGLGFALQSGDNNGFDAGAFGQDVPIAFSDSSYFESDASFSHMVLCLQIPVKTNGPVEPSAPQPRGFLALTYKNRLAVNARLVSSIRAQLATAILAFRSNSHTFLCHARRYIPAVLLVTAAVVANSARYLSMLLDIP
jgi:hypothetical protein